MLRRRARGVVATAAIAGALLGAIGARAADGSPWNWFQGDERAHIAGSAAGDDLDLFALRDVNIGGAHIRIGGRDGNFEFEHDRGVSTSTLNAYIIGTPTRTPISIGGWDEQDIVSLIVGGAAKQASDLQQWKVNGKIVAAVDAKGNLELNSITLSLAVKNGKAVLFAELPDGTKQVLATGSSTRTTGKRKSKP